MIRQDFIDRLLSSVDLPSLIGEYMELRGSGTTLEGLCPFHAEKSASFKVFPADTEAAHYHCFGCGAHGGPLEFLMRRNALGFVDAVRLLAQREGMPIEYEEKPESEQDKRQREEAGQVRQRIYGVLRKAAGEYHKRLFAPEGEKAMQELERRGIGAETVLRYSIGFAPDAWDTLTENWAFSRPVLLEAGLSARRSNNAGSYDMFRNRIMFPIFSQRGQVVAFGGRTLTEGENAGPKYLNSPETAVYRKGTELFGLYQARDAIRQEEHVVVAEGYFDVVTPSQHGINYIVSTCGTVLSEQQLDLLLGLSKRVTFCFDGDAAGEKATRRAAELLLPFITDEHEIRMCRMPKGHDPDSLVREGGPEAFRDVLTAAPTLAEYLVRETVSAGRLDSLEGKAAIAVQLIRYWKQLNAPVLAALFCQRASEAVGLSQADFNRLVVVTSWKPVEAAVSLLPCPFCKGAAQMMSDGDRFAVRCRQCKCRTMAVPTREEAGARWAARS